MAETLLYSISNIAWPESADDEALALVAELGFDGVEIAPGKVFGPLSDVSEETVRRYRAKLDRLGLRAPAMQAILFGASDARLFGSPEEKAALYARLGRVAEVAGWLGVKACVFGAPAVRDPGNMPRAEAIRDAQRFFAAIAPLFAQNNATLCLEANPEIYNCRFITRTVDALEMVRAVDALGFGLQFDAGTFFANDEASAVDSALLTAATHFHVSEPHLVPIGSAGVEHAQLAALVLNSGYRGWVSVEMRAADDWQQAIKDAAGVLETHYGKRSK